MHDAQFCHAEVIEEQLSCELCLGGIGEGQAVEDCGALVSQFGSVAEGDIIGKPAFS